MGTIQGRRYIFKLKFMDAFRAPGVDYTSSNQAPRSLGDRVELHVTKNNYRYPGYAASCKGKRTAGNGNGIFLSLELTELAGIKIEKALHVASHRGEYFCNTKFSKNHAVCARCHFGGLTSALV